MFFSSIRLLDTSLPQHGSIGTGSDVVSKLTGHNGGAAFEVSEHPMVARSPNVMPALLFQCLDQVSNLDRHNSSYDDHLREVSMARPWGMSLNKLRTDRRPSGSCLERRSRAIRRCACCGRVLSDEERSGTGEEGK